MNEQQNVEIVRRGYEAFGRGDLNALLELLDENIEWMSSGPPELPTAGRRRGRQEVAEFFDAVDTLFEIQRFEPETFIAQGDRVVVLGGETSRVKATGKILDFEWVHVLTLRNSKVVALHEYLDTAALMAELQASQRTPV